MEVNLHIWVHQYADNPASVSKKIVVFAKKKKKTVKNQSPYTTGYLKVEC